MYSSPLTGLSIQYNRRTCEDSSDWKSVLDSSVSCNSLSPTDEKCHHIDVNGETGFQSCPKACGNCFEDSPDTSNDRMNNLVNQQPMGLYSGENAETNEFEEMGSQLRNRGDLEDLFYQFTYEVNNKLDELSERISMTEDVEDARERDREEEAAEGRVGSVCAKQVCKVNTNKPDEPALLTQWQNACNHAECGQKLFSTCLEQRFSGEACTAKDPTIGDHVTRCSEIVLSGDETASQLACEDAEVCNYTTVNAPEKRNCCELIVDENQNNISPELAPEPTPREAGGDKSCSPDYHVFPNTTEEIINEDKMIYLRTIGAQLTEESGGVGDTSSGSQAMTNKNFAIKTLKKFKITNTYKDGLDSIDQMPIVGESDQPEPRYYFDYQFSEADGSMYICLQPPSQPPPPSDMKVDYILIKGNNVGDEITLDKDVEWSEIPYDDGIQRYMIMVDGPERISNIQVIVRIRIKMRSEGTSVFNDSVLDKVAGEDFYIYGIYSKRKSPETDLNADARIKRDIKIYGSDNQFDENYQLKNDITCRLYSSDRSYGSLYCSIENPNFYLKSDYKLIIKNGDGGAEVGNPSIKKILLKHPAFKNRSDDKIYFSVFENFAQAKRNTKPDNSGLNQLTFSVQGVDVPKPVSLNSVTTTDCSGAVTALKAAQGLTIGLFLCAVVAVVYLFNENGIKTEDVVVVGASFIVTAFLLILWLNSDKNISYRRWYLNAGIGIWWLCVVLRSFKRKVWPDLDGDEKRVVSPRAVRLIILSTLLLINFSVGEEDANIEKRIYGLGACKSSGTQYPKWVTWGIIFVQIVVAGLIFFMDGRDKLFKNKWGNAVLVVLAFGAISADFWFVNSLNTDEPDPDTSYLYGFTPAKIPGWEAVGWGAWSQPLFTGVRALRNFILLF